MIQKIIYIVGPTASGKTDLSNNLARFFNLPVLSMDSMQIYKNLDIGTSKPSKEDLNTIKYYGIDIIDPDEEYSVADYLSYAKKVILNNDYPAIIITGGTGLYYDALNYGFSKIPSKNNQIRQRLYSIYKEEGIQKLYQNLIEVDGLYAEKIEKNDLKRIIRALEVYEITKKPFSSFHFQKDIEPLSAKTLKFGILMPRNRLYQRINKRVDFMIENGLVSEGKMLYDKYKNKDLASLKALGYLDLFNFFNGFISIQDTIDAIKKKTRNYAKRQITWFKKDKEINWLYLLDDEQMDIAKNIDLDNLNLIKNKRKKNRINYENIESEIYEFICGVKNYAFITEKTLFEYLKNILIKFIEG